MRKSSRDRGVLVGTDLSDPDLSEIALCLKREPSDHLSRLAILRLAFTLFAASNRSWSQLRALECTWRNNPGATLVQTDSTTLRWSGGRSILESIPTLHWRSDDRLTEGVLRFRVYCLPHLVYPSLGRVALFQVDSCRGKVWPCLRWGCDRAEIFTRSRGSCRY